MKENLCHHLIDHATDQVEQAARNNEDKDDISCHSSRHSSEPAVPLVQSNELLSSNCRNSLNGASDALSPNTPGGLVGRIAALAGIDSADPDPRVLPPHNDTEFDDGLPQPWLFRALTGRLR